jgi:hypothetical protein
MSLTSIECSSQITRVVVYARGAVVTRTVALPDTLPDAVMELVVPGVTALADAGSVRARADGDREVIALAARLALPAAPLRPGALAERVRALELDRPRLDAERRSLTALREALAATALDPAMARWAKRLDPAARFADALALSGLLGAEMERLDGLLRGNAEALEKNERDTAAAQVAAAQGTAAELEGDERARLEVRVRFGAGQGALRALDVEYVVGAARWWPAYTARFTAAATRVSLTLDAFIAQASGEDWGRVQLSLSTAHLAHDARLPELRSLRFGRSQPAPRRGYRPPPEGLGALFEGYDRAVREGEKRLAPGATTIDTIFAEMTPTPDDTRTATLVATRGAMPPSQGGYGVPAAKGAAMWAPPGFGAPPPMSMPTSSGMVEDDDLELGASMAMPSAAPARRVDLKARLGKTAMPSPERAKHEARGGGMAAEEGAAPLEPEQPAAIEPGDAWLDFDALVLADPGDRAHRGRLVRDPAARAGAAGQAAWATFERMEGPPMTRDPFATRGRFDHRHDAEGTRDVPSSGRPHRVTVASAEAAATPRFVAVPREAASVYREVEVQNPFAAPLLGGPVDVFLDGALMTTSELAFVDRSGKLYLGLGVEERLRVARNARVEEGSAGLLGGSAVIDHAITIDLSSSLGRKVTVEVLERVPVTDEKDVEVKLTYARPESEKYTQAERGAPIRRGVRFRVEVPAGDKAKIELGYRITLPAKNELIGGNRRE